MEILDGVISGFGVALSPTNLLWVTLGVVLGTVVGALPGMGPTAAIALLLPMTFSLEPASAIIMLAGIYYGSMYGGRIPAILLRIPGDASSVVTTFDGYPLAQQGRAGSALGITAIGSFLGGTMSIVGLTLFAPVLAGYAREFSAPEFFALTLVGIIMIAYLGSRSRLKSLLMAGLGILVGTVGMDAITATERFTFGVLDLSGGINVVPIAVGLFGVGEILYQAERANTPRVGRGRVSNVLPSMADWVRSRAAIARSAVLGFVVGLLPGGGGAVSSLMAYAMEKRLSREPHRFGSGAVEGLASTETADNASSNSAFVPLLTLGIPPNPVLALMFGALLLQNITPGPQLVDEHPDVFWGVIASMYVGNILLLVLNLPLIGVFVQLLRIRQTILAPLIVIIAMCGVFSINNSTFDMWLVVVFGVVGYLMKKLAFEPGPFVLAFILGPIMEAEFRRAMLMSGGDPSVFLTRPISGTITVTLVLFVVVATGRALWRHNRTATTTATTTGSPVSGDQES